MIPLLKLVLTIAALGSAWWYLQRATAVRSSLPGAVRATVRSRTVLAKGASAVCVDVDGRRLLLGVAAGAQVSVLADLGDAPDVEELPVVETAALAAPVLTAVVTKVVSRARSTWTARRGSTGPANASQAAGFAASVAAARAGFATADAAAATGDEITEVAR
jgi:flagellar biogenesis protein FliO